MTQDRVLGDPDYNALLATSYIAGLNERFDGNVVLVSAGYNAGPRRASDWIERFGDPRQEDADGIIYWIEAIPFTETRNYIMRVTESLAIYEAQLTGEMPEIGLTERLLALGRGHAGAPQGEDPRRHDDHGTDATFHSSVSPKTSRPRPRRRPVGNRRRAAPRSPRPRRRS
jgi:hypothetical protein